MNLSPVIDIVSKYSPVLGAIISAANPLAGVVFSAIANTVGANPANINEVKERLTSDPDIAFKLKQLEIKYAEIDSENYKAELNDLSDARDRDRDVIEDASKPDASIVVSIIALVPHLLTLLTGFAIVLVVILRLYDKCPNVNDTMLTMIVGQLLMIFGRQCKFYYGASKNDSEKV